MRIIATVSVLVGVAGIAWIVNSVGPDKLSDALSKLSLPKFAVALFFYYLMFVFDALAWRQIIHRKCRPSLWILWKAAIAGNSINQLTPGGNIGEPLKIMVLENRANLDEIIASLVVWNFMHLAANMGIVLLGALPIFLYLQADASFMLLYLAGAIILGLPAALLLATFRFNIFSRLAVLASKVHIRANRLAVWQKKVKSIEKCVVDGIKKRPGDIAISAVHLMISRAISVSMAFLIIWALDMDIPFITAIYIQMLNLAVNTFFSFVPGRIGVMEGYNAMIFKALQYTPQAGLAVSIVLRIIQIITTIIGISVLAGPMLRARRQKTA